MKTQRSIGRSRNASLNRLRSACDHILAQLKTIEGTPHNKLISSAEFWEEVRALVFDASQRFHEANAYNNALADDGTTFEQDEFVATKQ